MINTALIGAGYWGTNLARVIEASPEFKLLAVADLVPERGCSVEDLRERDDLDAVIIATPATTHVELVIEALTARRHVLVTKPLALRYDDAEFCCNLADEEGLQLMVDLTYRYSPGLAATRSALVGLGEVTALWSTRWHDGGPGDVNSVTDLLPHDLSIIEALCPQWLDQPPLVMTTGNAEVGMVWLGWPVWEDRRAAIEFSRRSPEKIRRISVTTATGERVRWIDHPVPRVFIERPDHDEIIEVPVAPGEALAATVEAFATAITTGKPAPSSGRSTLRAIEVTERINEEWA